MKQLTLIAIALSVLLSGLLIPHRATAADGYHSFVKQEYYLGAGNQPVPLRDITKNHFRSEAAYLKFKQGFEDALGRSLTDEALRQILGSDGVRLVPCRGYLMTSGINDLGQTNDFERGCYRGEQLIELRVNGHWKLIASQGCLNPVFWQRQPAPQPRPKSEPKLRVGQSGLLDRPAIVVQTPGMFVPDCCCGPDTYLPGATIIID